VYTQGMVSEEPISTKLQARIQQLQPETRRVATWAMPPAPLFGELCSLTAGALGVEQPVIDPAVSVEFFRAFGLTRVSLLSQPTSQHPADASALLLAGDQFLAICFEQFTQHDAHPTTLSNGVSTLVSASQQIGFQHSEGSLDGTAVAAESGALAMSLASILTDSDVETDTYTHLQRAGKQLGVALLLQQDGDSTQAESNEHTPQNPTTSQAVWPASSHTQPAQAIKTSSDMNDRDSLDPLSDHRAAAKSHLDAVSPSVSSAVTAFFNRLKK